MASSEAIAAALLDLLDVAHSRVFGLSLRHEYPITQLDPIASNGVDSLMRLQLAMSIFVAKAWLSPAAHAGDKADEAVVPVLGNVVGAVWQSETGRLHLIGDGDALAARVSTQDVAVALRWAIGRSDTPGYVSIDPDEKDPHGPLMRVVVSGSALNTSFGWIMFEADRIMKSLSLGFDSISREPLRVGVPGFQNTIEIAESLREESQGVWSRFWLQPGRHMEEVDERAMRILDARIVVDTEIMQMERGRLVSTGGTRHPSSERFARFFSEQYRAIAREEPIFGRLEQLLRLLLVAEWARSRALPLDWAWIEREAAFPYLMPAVTPSITASGESSRPAGNGRVLTRTRVFGGVSFEGLKLEAAKRDLRALEAAVKRVVSLRDGTSKLRLDGKDLSLLSLPATPAATASSVRQLSEISLPGGGIFRLYGRSPTAGELSLHDPGDIIVVTPHLFGINPNPAERVAASGTRIGGWRRAQGYQGVQGVADSKVPVRSYQLTGADQRLLSAFADHDIDQLRQRIVVKPTKSASTWTVEPLGEDLVRAFEKPDHLYTFDPGSGLLIGEQVGGSLVRYWYNRQGVLERITFGGNDGTAKQLFTGEHGSSGHRLLRLRREDGGDAIELSAPSRLKGQRTVAVSVVLDQPHDTESVTLDLATGNLTGNPGPLIGAVLGPRGHRLAALVARKGTEPALIDAGAFTIAVTPDRTRVHIIGSALEDKTRTTSLLRKAQPATPPQDGGPLRRVIERELPAKRDKEQLDRLRNFYLETALNSSARSMDRNAARF